MFDGGIFLIAAKALLEGICGCCATVFEGISGFDPFEKANTLKSTISAAATTIATLLVVIELCSQAMGFHFDDVNDAVRFGLKVVVYKIIIENSSKIVNLVYGIFIDDGKWSAIADQLNKMGETFDKQIVEKLDAEWSAVNQITWLLGVKPLILGLLLLIITILVCALVIKIMAQIAGLLFELAINIAIAPVPIATLVNSQTRSIGIGFIKGFAGNCMTLLMYSLCFEIYESISVTIQNAFVNLLPEASGDFYLYGGLAGVAVSVVLLSVAINNVSTMINKVLS